MNAPHLPSGPSCYQCSHRRDLPGNCHSRCANAEAKVSAVEHGVKNGWFYWPMNFDPVWLVSCTGFQQKEAA